MPSASISRNGGSISDANETWMGTTTEVYVIIAKPMQSQVMRSGAHGSNTRLRSFLGTSSVR